MLVRIVKVAVRIVSPASLLGARAMSEMGDDGRVVVLVSREVPRHERPGVVKGAVAERARGGCANDTVATACLTAQIPRVSRAKR